MSDRFARNVHCILGLPFDAVDLAGAMGRVRKAAAARTPFFLSTPNLNFLIACRSDPAFRDSVINSDLSIADGMPIVWVARLLGIPIRDRVAGAGLFEALQASPDSRLAVYFFGGPEGVAATARAKLNAASAGLVCVGCESPGFGSVEEMSGNEYLQRINDSQPDFLVVALGARKGQAWIERNRAQLQVPVVGHLGAVINHAAGAIRRAPKWMQRAGLEWLWRIREEPALWRRYFRDGWAFCRLFVSHVLPQWWQERRNRPSPAELAAATVRTETTQRLSIVVLCGAWGHANLERLRARLSEDFLADRDLYMDMASVSHVDSAFIGLVMLLYGHQKQQGRRLRLGATPPQVRRAFAHACADFLYAST